MSPADAITLAAVELHAIDTEQGISQQPWTETDQRPYLAAAERILAKVAPEIHAEGYSAGFGPHYFPAPVPWWEVKP